MRYAGWSHEQTKTPRAVACTLGLLLLTQCSAEACGCHIETRGPSSNVEVRTHEPLQGIPEGKQDYVGVWKAPKVRLAIEPSGALSYSRTDGTGPVSIESSIQRFDARGFTVGHGEYTTIFEVNRAPHEEAGRWKMTVDEVELTRIEDNRGVALKYMNGDGVPVDRAKAVELFAKACDDDDILSCAMLGHIYRNGDGVVQDYTKAVALLEKACDAKELESCATLGVLYVTGEGAAKDVARAYALFSDACERHDSTGCGNLGLMYDQGLGVPKDQARAAELYEYACERGKADACHNLSVSYESGEGVTKDLKRAAELARRACRGGRTDDCKYLGIPNP